MLCSGFMSSGPMIPPNTYILYTTLFEVVRCFTVQATSNHYAEYERQQLEDFLPDVYAVWAH